MIQKSEVEKMNNEELVTGLQVAGIGLRVVGNGLQVAGYSNR
mgnify:CR=1 FL=1